MNQSLNLQTLPKAELHIHLEGAAPWSSIVAAFNRHYNCDLPATPHFYDPQFRFADFQAFLDCFRKYIHPWLKTPNGYLEMVQAVVDSLIAQNMRYVELNINASTFERFGLSADAIFPAIAAILAAAEERGTTIRLIAGILRHEGPDCASAWVRQFVKNPLIDGFDLHGSEYDYPASLFADTFAPVRDSGKKLKVHAGEMVEPHYIRLAVEKLGVTQIGHGTSAIQDTSVVDLLRSQAVLVEMCPTSNERLQNVQSYAEHPILALDAAGVAVTVNSDDPAFFGITLTQEIERLVEQRHVTAPMLARWLKNAFSRAIATENQRQQWLAEVDAWVQAHSLDD
jgi:adenosine deaminase